MPIFNENFDKLSPGIKSLDCFSESLGNCDELTKPSVDCLSESLGNCDDLTKPPVDEAVLEKSKDPPDDEVEAGEIYSPKGPEFEQDCELDFEDGEDERCAEKETSLASLITVDVPSKEIEAETEDDDGELLSDEGMIDEDFEEGELKEGPKTESNSASEPNPPTKTVCRYYHKGNCFFGNNCRFLHVNYLKTGNYSMFAPARVRFSYGPESTPPIGIPHGMINYRSAVPPPRTGPYFPPVPEFFPEAPLAPDALDSAWEVALKDVKEMVKRANKRKVEEPDFEDKRLNLSVVDNEKNIPENPYKKKKRETYFLNREFSKSPDFNMERYRDNRLQEPLSRSRADYFDPWGRSKSPKGLVRRTRSRSGSYSSLSSYSSRSSRSRSYSRSSSSSRSPHQKRTTSPPTVNPSFTSSKMGSNKFTTMKNIPGRKKRPSSRSMSRSPSRSRSRSFSRSISVDSVSSASSSISHSSHYSEPHTGQNSHASNLRKQGKSSTGEKSLPITVPAVNLLPTTYLNYNPPNKDIRIKVEKTEISKEKPPVVDENERDPLDENFLTPASVDVTYPSLQHLLPSNDKAKEPFKGTLHKQQIKLTLLKKNPKLNNMPKKDFDFNRKTNDEASKPVGFYTGVEDPFSPPVFTKPASVLVPKKSASSRRDELLKQLKAVEDAIARKRAKFD